MASKNWVDHGHARALAHSAGATPDTVSPELNRLTALVTTVVITLWNGRCIGVLTNFTNNHLPIQFGSKLGIPSLPGELRSNSATIRQHNRRAEVPSRVGKRALSITDWVLLLVDSTIETDVLVGQLGGAWENNGGDM